MKTIEDFTYLLSSQFCVNSSEIVGQSDLVKDLGADSFDIMELLIGLEDEFNIEIDHDIMVKCKTVQDIIELVNSML